MLTRWKQEFLEYSKGAIKRGMTEPEKELRAEKELYQELESQYLLKVNTGKMSPDVIEMFQLMGHSKLHLAIVTCFGG